MNNDYIQFTCAEEPSDTLDVRAAFGGGVILDAWNQDSYADGPQSTSIELDKPDVMGLIEALVKVARIDALDLIERLTGATFEVAS